MRCRNTNASGCDWGLESTYCTLGHARTLFPPPCRRTAPTPQVFTYTLKSCVKSEVAWTCVSVRSDLKQSKACWHLGLSVGLRWSIYCPSKPRKLCRNLVVLKLDKVKIVLILPMMGCNCSCPTFCPSLVTVAPTPVTFFFKCQFFQQ